MRGFRYGGQLVAASGGVNCVGLVQRALCAMEEREGGKGFYLVPPEGDGWCLRPAAERVESTWSDRASEDGAAELVDEPPEHSNRSEFYSDEGHEKLWRHPPQPNLRWLLDYDPLFATRIFHIFEPRSTGDIPSYAPSRGAVDDKGNITNWPFVI